MILSASIVSTRGDLFCSNYLPTEIKSNILEHVNNFLYALSIEDDDTELPYIESTNVRYVYKQTGDLYWLLVTKPDSDLFTDINLLGKFVCTIMEYGSPETNSMTITEEQRELFYKHIWRPWDEDSQCPSCSLHCDSPEIWAREFENRLQFLIDSRDGHVEENDVTYFSGLIAESWVISAKLSPKWDPKNKKSEYESDTDSVCSSDDRNQSISEETVIECCRLRCRLEDIRVELNRIQDPYLRLFARRDLLAGSAYQNGHLSSAPSIKELESYWQCDSDSYPSSSL